ncbi:hypothetical protein HKD37_12G033851 [Glycine soja]
MLGKHGWRLQTNHGNICSKLNSSSLDFLDAHLGHNSSFIWRSIHACFPSSGEGSLEMEDRQWKFYKSLVQPWLNSAENYYISSPTIVGHEILDATMFTNEDVLKITMLPLFNTMADDKLVWKLSLNDNNHLKVPSSWVSLWKLQIQPKIKHFVWSLLRGGRSWLKKGVQCPVQCAFCSNNTKSEGNILAAAAFKL